MHVFSNSEMNDIKIVDLFYGADTRGSFTKIYNKENMVFNNLDFPIKEIYYSVSRKNTIRGMHFQMHPYGVEKLVHVIKGSVVDVVVDLRTQSETYKKWTAISLSAENKQAVYIPNGFAHGFKALEDDTVMLYCVSDIYCKEADTGIRYDSINFNWQLENPIVSDRDLSFITLQEFQSPF